jgi:ribonuclease-3
LSGAHPELTQSLGYRFRDPALLERALTHRSKSSDNNERLEFLGDGVLNFSIAATLYERFPQLTEGELTRLRAGLVRMETLAGLARRLRLGGFLGLGGGELKSGGHDRDSILADALEAVFGAIYEDAGFDVVHRVIQGLYRDALAGIDPQSVLKDPKTRLQEYLQKQSISTPSYNVLEIVGEPHQQRFIVECSVPGLPQPVRGEGLSRRAAEQQAASSALEALLARDA